MIASGRVKIFSCIFLALFLAVAGRVFYLQIYRQTYYKKLSLQQIRQTSALPAKRGNITDRNGILLASSIDAYSVDVTCREIADASSAAEQLATALNLKKSEVLEQIKDKNRFIRLKRRISAQEAEKIKNLKLSGVHLIHGQQRVYLRGQLASSVLGFVDQDDQGAGGLEISQEKYLQGIPGELIIEKDLSGRELHVSDRILKEARDGDNITLTIDEFLQYTARKQLAAALREERADSGSVIIMDTASGEILAMVSLPDYDPARYFAYPPENLRNSAIQTVYEPGSVFKLITVAAALDSGLVTPGAVFVNGNTFAYAGQTIRESHTLKDPDRPRPLKEIISESLNISAAKLALGLGKEKMREYQERFQLNRRTGLELYGESAGLIKSLDRTVPLDLAVSGYGHGFSVTPLQMLAAVNAIANDGVYVQPKIIRHISNNKGDLLKDFSQEISPRRIITPQTAWHIRAMMQECVQKGTGMLAGIPGYSIGGKTGTSQRVNPGGRGYLPGSYISSFAGIIPGNKPRLTILVVIDNPKKSYYGGYVAAPVFREIAKEAARYLAIPEDL